MAMRFRETNRRRIPGPSPNQSSQEVTAVVMTFHDLAIPRETVMKMWLRVQIFPTIHIWLHNMQRTGTAPANIEAITTQP